MTKLRSNALLACLLLALGSSALANDPPKDPPKDAKKEEEKPAEPDLPSKPYPKNAVPKAFLPKTEEKKEAAAKPDAGHDKPAEKHAEKAAEKPVEKSDDKHAVVKFDGGHDQPAVVVAPKRRKVARAAHAPAAHAAATHAPNPVIQQVAGESVKTASSDRDAYVAQKNDTLDKVIAKTFPKTPFSMEIMREAFVRANPQLRPPVKNVKLNAGQLLQLPDVNVMRMVVMGEGSGSGATMAVSSDVHYEKKQNLFVPAATAPAAVAPAAAVQKQIAIPPLPVNVASSAPTQEVSAEEKKKWVRYP